MRSKMYTFHPKKTRPITGKQQKGVAIITALLIVTIAVTISISISTQLQLDVRRTGNLIAQDQADFYLFAAEEWSQRILKQDKKDSTIDALSEDWAIALPPLPVAGGTIQGKLTDLHSCININSLVTGDAINATTQARLRQLFKNLGVADLTPAIIDWIDTNQETTPDGAEDGYYLNLDNPYHTANTPLLSITELRLVKGFEESETYRLIAPHLCAYVTEGKDALINVNTASVEVLKSLSAEMNDNIAKNIIECRDNEPFKDLIEFNNCAKLETIIKDKAKLSTSSDYFLLRTQAIIGQASKVMYSIIYRDDSGKTKIISRTQRTL